MQKTLYLFASGRLGRKDHTIYVENEEGKKYFPVKSIRDIYVYGEVDLNKKLLEFMEENEIVLHFFDYYGNYAGSFYPREHYNSGYMILRQAEHYLDPDRRLALARGFVKGALANILQVLRYYQRKGKEVAQYVEAIEKLVGESFPACKSIEELMAVEGNVRGYYYNSFNKILEDAPFTIDGRSKRPPTDPLNALISFGNSLMYTKILSEIYKTHLDPRIGYLHATNFRRFTLNLDVAEIFKPIIADRVLFTLVGKKMVGTGDFERRGGAYLLKESAKKIYVQEMEEKLKDTFHHSRLKRHVSYLTVIRMELYKIEKHLIGEQPYEPFISRW